MTITPLISLAGSVGAALAGAAAQAIGNSPFAKLLAGESEAAPNPLPLEGLASSLEEMQASARAALDQFHQQLGQKLAELGITLAQPVTLAIDSFGKIRETSGHPQGPEVEALLAEDRGLADLFRQSATNFELARAGREQSQFQALYAQQPELAVQRYRHLLDERRSPPPFSAHVTATGAEPLFE